MIFTHFSPPRKSERTKAKWWKTTIVCLSEHWQEGQKFVGFLFIKQKKNKKKLTCVSVWVQLAEKKWIRNIFYIFSTISWVSVSIWIYRHQFSEYESTEKQPKIESVLRDKQVFHFHLVFFVSVDYAVLCLLLLLLRFIIHDVSLVLVHVSST